MPKSLLTRTKLPVVCFAYAIATTAFAQSSSDLLDAADERINKNNREELLERYRQALEYSGMLKRFVGATAEETKKRELEIAGSLFNEYLDPERIEGGWAFSMPSPLPPSDGERIQRFAYDVVKETVRLKLSWDPEGLPILKCIYASGIWRDVLEDGAGCPAPPNDIAKLQKRIDTQLRLRDLVPKVSQVADQMRRYQQECGRLPRAGEIDFFLPDSQQVDSDAWGGLEAGADDQSVWVVHRDDIGTIAMAHAAVTDDSAESAPEKGCLAASGGYASFPGLYEAGVGHSQCSHMQPSLELHALVKVSPPAGYNNDHRKLACGMGSPPVLVEMPARFSGMREYAGRYELKREEFAKFVEQSKYVTVAEAPGGKGCHAMNPGTGEIALDSAANWRNPGFRQGDDHPVVCVSYNDAQAYLKWLNKFSPGGVFQLAGNAWVYGFLVTGASSADELAKISCAAGNIRDVTKNEEGLEWSAVCSDGHFYTAPAGSFPPSADGVHDWFGNVSELTEEQRPESDSGQLVRAIFGGSWANTAAQFDFVKDAQQAGGGFIAGVEDDDALSTVGFRVSYSRRKESE
jgi:formylglycine-generating enzyme required for sulfatase activity